MHRARTTAAGTRSREGSPQARKVVLAPYGTRRETNARLEDGRCKTKRCLQQSRNLSKVSQHQRKFTDEKSIEFPRQQKHMSKRSGCQDTGREHQRRARRDDAEGDRPGTHENSSVRSRGLPTFKQISALSAKARERNAPANVNRRDAVDPYVDKQSALSYKLRRRSAAGDVTQRDAAEPYFEDRDPSCVMDPYGPEDLETRVSAGRDDVAGIDKTGEYVVGPESIGARTTAGLDDALDTQLCLSGGHNFDVGDFETRMHAGCEDAPGRELPLGDERCLASSSSSSAHLHTVDAPCATLINISNKESQPFTLPLPPMPKARETVDPDELKMCFPTLTALASSAESRPSAQIEEEPHAFQRWSELLLQEAKLQFHKRRAVACEDYQGAGNFKSLLQELEPCLLAARDLAVLCGVPSIKRRLEEQKREAVAKEDYAEASRLKRRVLQLSTEQDNASLHEAMLGALELAKGLGALEDGPALVEELTKALADHETAAVAVAAPVLPKTFAVPTLASSSASAAAAAIPAVALPAPAAPGFAASLDRDPRQPRFDKQQSHSLPPDELSSQHASLNDSQNDSKHTVKEKKEQQPEEEKEPMVLADAVEENMMATTNARDEVSESTAMATALPPQLAATDEVDLEQVVATRQFEQQDTREEVNKQLRGEHQKKRCKRQETRCPIPGMELEQFMTMSKQDIWQKAWDDSWRAEDALGRSDDAAEVYRIARKTWKAWVAQRNALAASTSTEVVS